MPWPLMALLTALCQSAQDLLARRLLRRGGLSSRLLMGVGCLVAAVAVLPLALLKGPAPQIPSLLIALAATGVLNGLAFWAYGRALCLGQLSLVVPLLNLSPLVLLFSGWWMLGEKPGLMSMGGLLLLLVGALRLGASEEGAHGLWRAPGARWMLLVAVLWGIGAGIDKLGVRASGTWLWVVGLNLVVGIPLTVAAIRGAEFQRLSIPPFEAQSIWRSSRALVLLFGLIGALGMALQMEAVQRTAVVQVIAIKRLSTLFTAAVGGCLLGEPRPGQRLPAVALMLAGAVLVLLSPAA